MKRILIHRMLLIGLAIFTSAQLFAAESEEIGLKVGGSIPDFKAKDQSGKVRTFADLRGPKGLLFIFYRSANW